ncbi:hypothetical protein DY000_02013118 [Brassica cretica]|uniref:Uncharacterized protein n=1 Tax=Brassica cretica TaxID=69181 RepID=A0ABQ7D241_BRACR|nr:hypothetical protein DY000_02013118 [Brassica cretica]
MTGGDCGEREDDGYDETISSGDDWKLLLDPNKVSETSSQNVWSRAGSGGFNEKLDNEVKRPQQISCQETNQP